MYQIALFFAISGIVLSALAIVSRLTKRSLRKDRAELLLSVALFAIMWFIFIYILLITRTFAHVPNLYNKGIPLYYLIAPCFYLYVRLKLYPADGWPRYWWLHGLPFVFGLIDILPYLFVSQQEKQVFMARLAADLSLGFQHPYGFVPQSWHHALRLLLSFFYLMAQWGLLFMADAEGNDHQPWRRFPLYFFTVMFSLFTLLQASMALNIFSNRPQAAYILDDAGRLVWVSGLYLLFSAWICFGMRRNS